MSDIGKTIYARNKSAKGKITNIIDQYCAGCGKYGRKYSVKWEDGTRTFPCPAGCKCNKDGSIEII